MELTKKQIARKKYYLKHRDRIRREQSKYYELNKEDIKERNRNN